MGYFWGRGRVQKSFWGLLIRLTTEYGSIRTQFPVPVVVVGGGGGGRWFPAIT